MNAKKCCYTIFSNGSRGDLDFDLRLNSESIPYNSNPVFLGITFDESLCFHKHFENLNITKSSKYYQDILAHILALKQQNFNMYI